MKLCKAIIYYSLRRCKVSAFEASSDF